MKEADGCALLLQRFTEAGYSIAQNFHFQEGDISVDLDGWDETKRVGYEYITAEAGDQRSFDAKTLAAFEKRMEKGELFVLLIDEHDAITADALSAAATGFLGELAKAKK
jgi:hypothetical protein